MNKTITITYGENVENHVGNQQIGTTIDNGVSYKNLKKIQKNLTKQKYNCDFVDLKAFLKNEYINDAEDAGVLIVKDFVNTFFKKNDKSTTIFQELAQLNWDKKCKMYGRVVNKKARHNLCFADFSQEPDYENDKGRVYNFKDLPDLDKMRKFLEKLLHEDLNAEGNYYYDTDKCYIGYHGDTERKIVAGVRFGSDFPLYYRWYQYSEPVSAPHQIDLSSGDLYIMSDKAVGYDWKTKSTLTLRHAAGEESQKIKKNKKK
jgi:alkylated DNA repair dioxygenase AlkB